MRTILSDTAAASRTQLHAILVPKAGKIKLPDLAPRASTWKADFGDDNGANMMLRGEAGKRWLLIRVPGAKETCAEDVRAAAGRARNKAEKYGFNTVSIDLGMLPNSAAFAQAAAEGAGMASYDSGICKKDRKKNGVKTVQIVGAGNARATKAAVKGGKFGAMANIFARELQNLPANILNPKEFAKRARKVCNASPKTTVKVLGEKRMAEMGMGSLLGVSQGSANEAQLVHMVYKPKGKAKGKLALVGKGLTFDTGGISLKPSAAMEDMKFDMSGAAAVLGVFHALAKGATCPYEVHGILGCVENMPGANAQRPGDIVTAMNKMTIEVHNTDAEGRLVLADCLTYTARKIKPDRIYDMATLTGAAIHALGHLHSAVIGTDQKAIDEVVQKSADLGEPCWQLPINEDYRNLTRGKYADLQNIYAPGQGAGTIAGACFLSFFVDDIPWVHLDIAATAWVGPSRSYMSHGGRGVIARTMLEVIRD
ncbi:MAG: leucyl aminopeptidase [Planctomycetota bacterium]|jgi:leucyl aminopeptidase|nr:leucyl aminopeptidase [Planctomycetota bacterium]